MASSGVRAIGRRHNCSFAYRTQLIKEGVQLVNASPKKKNNVHKKISKWVMEVCGKVESLEFASTAKERLRGMLFRDPDDVTRILIPCHDIHTFGMRYPIDVAFISRDGHVLEVHRNVSTKKRIKRKDASLVAERFSRSGEWLKEGDVIRIGTIR